VAKDIQELIDELADFRRRSAAIREIGAMGDSAVQPLIAALEASEQEGTRWAVLRCLGVLKARDAIPQIAQMLEDRRYRTSAHETLVRIVGEDLGESKEAWLNWVQGSGAAADSAKGASALLRRMSGHTDDRLMALALKDSGASYKSAGHGRYLAEVPAEGATQPVSVRLDARDHEGSPICIVYADCGPADPQHYEYALKRNFKTPYGALAVRDSSDGSRFVMFNTIVREALSPVELRKSIFTVAERTARVKRDLESGAELDPDSD
jgi:hypothetical protein